MRTKPYVFCLALLAMVAFVGLSGCAVPGKVTGGGSMPSANCLDWDEGNCITNNDWCQDKAHFGFNANSCGNENGDGQCEDGLPVSGHFNYVDMKADYKDGYAVKMNGFVTGAKECVPFSDDIELECTACNFLQDCVSEGDGSRIYEVELEYRSTNPKKRGEGYAFACVIDNGEGINAESADIAVIKVMTGPFRNYFNVGPVQGNIQAHECQNN